MKKTIGTSKANNWRNNWPERMKFLKRRIMIQRAFIACVRRDIYFATSVLRHNFAERWKDKYPEVWKKVAEDSRRDKK